MEFVEVGTVNDLADGQMVGFEVDDRRILLAKVEGEFFAIGGTCSHERSNLDQGALLGHVVYCPLHFSAFDVRSGAVLGPPAECPVPKHEVRVEDGRVLVCTQPCALESAAPAQRRAQDADAGLGRERGRRRPPPCGRNAAAVAQDVPADVADVTQDLRRHRTSPYVVTADAASIAQDVAADVAGIAQAAPEPAGATRELAEQVARLEQTVRESSGELAERVARLEQTVRELRSELAAAKPAQPASGGGDPWNHQSPRFMSRIPTSARYLPLAIAIPAGIVAAARPDLRSAVRETALPSRTATSCSSTSSVMAGSTSSSCPWWVSSACWPPPVSGATGRALQGTVPAALPRQPLGGALRGTAEEVIKHDGFETWTVTDVQRRFHLKIFYGFARPPGCHHRRRHLHRDLPDPRDRLARQRAVAAHLGPGQDRRQRRRDRPAHRADAGDVDLAPALLRSGDLLRLVLPRPCSGSPPSQGSPSRSCASPVSAWPIRPTPSISCSSSPCSSISRSPSSRTPCTTRRASRSPVRSGGGKRRLPRLAASAEFVHNRWQRTRERSARRAGRLEVSTRDAETPEPEGAPVSKSSAGSRVELQAVTKVYGEGPLAKLVVDECSFVLEPGEVTVMVGPSACGKSSIAFLIAGYERPTKGKILLDGKGVGGPSWDRLVVFQESALLPWLTTYENIMFGPKARGFDKKEMRAACRGAPGAGRVARVPRQVPDPALRRHAAPGGTRPGPDQRPQGHDSGRAFPRARPHDPRVDAGVLQQPARRRSPAPASSSRRTSTRRSSSPIGC